MILHDYKIAAGIAILITSLIAVIYPLKIHAKAGHNAFLELADAFASGIFLGAALFHMLPEAIKLFSTQLPHNSYPIAETFCGAGFLILLFLERLAGCRPYQHFTHGLPLMMTAILVIHALVEGTALGVSSTTTTTTMLFLAILAHKGSESFALAVILNRSKLSLSTLIVIAVFFSCMTPIGIGIGTVLTEDFIWQGAPLLGAGFSAFAAGTFLYMSTLHHINHHHHHHTENLTELWFLSAGLLLMAGLAFI